jgi:hypothetical protein
LPDFWFDAPEADAHEAEPFDQIALLIRKQTPRTETPILAVLGNYRRFTASALFKTGNRSYLFETVPITELGKYAGRTTCFIRWSPNGEMEVPQEHFDLVPSGSKIINQHSSTRKSDVHRAFAKAFGYSVSVDPRDYRGPAVEKSDRNAEHDGRIVRLPIAPNPGSVYERVIDNAASEGFVYDIRVPFIFGKPLISYIKFRPHERRFLNANSFVSLGTPSDVLTEEEQAKCGRLAAEMNVDYCEMDILRDGTSGKIFVVDVNDTPAGPPKGLPLNERSLALRFMALAFKREVFDRDH